jgi:hypothetical protein
MQSNVSSPEYKHTGAGRPRKAAAWGIRAAQVGQDAADTLVDIGINALAIGKDADRIDGMARDAIELLQGGDVDAAIRRLNDIRTFSASANHKAAWISRDSGLTAAAILKALIGHYDK